MFWRCPQARGIDPFPDGHPTAMRAVLATANPDKVAEINRLLGGVVELVARPDALGPVAEDADTLLGNAAAKAEAIRAATGEAAIADDTGLFVAALDGAPGVRSARYASEHATYDDNVAALLAAMEGMGDRRAEFRTVAIVVFPDGRNRWVQGSVRGEILAARAGTDGFGYDPVFVPVDGDGRSFGQMTVVEKNRISHRGAAFSALARLLSLSH